MILQVLFENFDFIYIFFNIKALLYYLFVCLGPATAHKMTRRLLFAPSPVTTQSLLNVQLNTGLSNSGMRQLASTLNKATGSRIIEPYFEQQQLVGTAAVGWNNSSWLEQQQLVGTTAVGWNSSSWLEQQQLVGTTAVGWNNSSWLEQQQLVGTTAVGWNNSSWLEQQQLVGTTAVGWNNSSWLEQQQLVGTTAVGWNNSSWLEQQQLVGTTAVGRSLDDYFKLTTVNISTEKGKSKEKKLIVYCKNLQELTNKVLLDRDYTPDYLDKLGIDGGGSFLKMSLSVINTFKEDDKTKCSQLKSMRSLTISTASDTGVKRLNCINCRRFPGNIRQ